MANKNGVRLSLSLAWLLLFVGGSVTHAQQTPTDAQTNVNCRVLVDVIGAVLKPGRYELQRGGRLKDAIILAGGVAVEASSKIRVEHSASASTCDKFENPNRNFSGVVVYSLQNLLKDDLKDDEKINPALKHGDAVTVLPAELVYIVGSVFSPQCLYHRGSLTLAQAIAMAGGLLSNSKTHKVIITRRALGDTVNTEIKVDLKAIRERRAQDLALEPNDVVCVLGKKSGGCRTQVHCAPPRSLGSSPNIRLIY